MKATAPDAPAGGQVPLPATPAVRPLPIRLQPFGRGDEHALQQAVSVYADTWGREWASSYRLAGGYAREPDFQGLLATLDDGREPARAVGMGFGHRGFRGCWWYDCVAAQVGQDHPALADAWILVELAVRPGYQHRGVGERLHHALLAAQPLPRVVLSTALDNRAAQRFYLRHGWSYLHATGFVFAAGQPPYVVMRREAREPVAGD